MALQRGVYRPRDAEHAVLHQVIAEHLEAFLRAVAEAGDGAGLPQFVEREFREFLTCGVFEHGVARFRCEGCAREHLVPFSCKGWVWCPSCGGHRMTERAAHLVDAVLPQVPVRQWVLTVPYRLRYQLAWNHGLSRAVLRCRSWSRPRRYAPSSAPPSAKAGHYAGIRASDRIRTSDPNISVNSATGFGPRFSPDRTRTATCSAATSRSPTTSMNGTFSSWARRILFCMRSSASSTSARKSSSF